MWNPGQDRWICNLVAVQMQNGQYRTVRRGIQKLVRVPARRQRSRLRLAIAHHARHNQVRIVERRPVSVHQGVAQLPAFVNRPRCLRRNVARNPVRPTELPEKPLDSVLVLFNVRIDLGVRPLKIRVRHQSRPAMPRPNQVNHVQVAFTDQPVPVDIQKIEPRCCAPVAQQPRLYVVQRQRAFQQRVVFQINLAHREVIGRAPVGVHFGQQFRTERAAARYGLIFLDHEAPPWN